MIKDNEVTLSINDLNLLIKNLKKEKAKDKETKKKGSFEKLKSGSYRFRYCYKSENYRETFDDIISDEEATKRLANWVKTIEDRNI